MKTVLALAFASFCGCATAPPVLSSLQVNAFNATVRQAEAAGATEGPQETAALLREAKSDFYYAQHLPADPDRARAVAVKAQANATKALEAAQANARNRLALRGDVPVTATANR
jgi:hypothetical protein